MMEVVQIVGTVAGVLNTIVVAFALYYGKLATDAGRTAVREAEETWKMEEEYRQELREAHEQELIEQEERHRQAQDEAAAERARKEWSQGTERLAEIAQLVVEVREAALVLQEENRLREPSQIPPADGSEWPIRGPTASVS